MRILFLGDIFGRDARSEVSAKVPVLREEWSLDFVVANCENATRGRGISPRQAAELFDCGIDCMTLGDHAYNQREVLPYLDQEPRLLRPMNYAPTSPGRGSRIFKATRGRTVLVVTVLGRLFMRKLLDDPFAIVRRELEKHRLGTSVDATIVEFHAEATSEKVAMGRWCDGMASLVVGTHTHIPTADAQLLSGGTAFLCDAGMCGNYDSVIGADGEEPIRRFTTGVDVGRLEPAAGPVTIAGVFIETNDKTGLAHRIAPVRLGGRLIEARP